MIRLPDSFEDFHYKSPKQFAAITSYYNPCGYKTRRYNYEIFRSTLKRSGIPLFTVECAFDNQPYDLPEALDIVKIRSRSVVWQKERLLNLAISWLPQSYRYIAWLDCDLLFLNPDWAFETVKLLKDYPLVQLFETCNRLPQENLAGIAEGNICQAFGTITPKDPSVLHSGRFDEHGHTGYGWATRREILEKVGLYEYAIAGSGDHYIAHAAFDDYDGICMRRMMANDLNIMNHFQGWGKKFYRPVKGRISAVSGQALHLWHGNLERRKYLLRHQELAKFGFNPYTDLTTCPGRPLEWRSTIKKPGLKKIFLEYFLGREEDGSIQACAT